MTEMAYGTNEQEFGYSEISEALEYLWDGDLEATQFTVYAGEVRRRKASYYAPSDVTDSLSENAYEEGGEFAMDWPGKTKEMSQELQAAIEKAIDEWADKHNCHPNFYMVENVKERHFKTVKESEYFDFDNFEEVEVL